MLPSDGTLGVRPACVRQASSGLTSAAWWVQTAAGMNLVTLCKRGLVLVPAITVGLMAPSFSACSGANTAREAPADASAPLVLDATPAILSDAASPDAAPDADQGSDDAGVATIADSGGSSEDSGPPNPCGGITPPSCGDGGTCKLDPACDYSTTVHSCPLECFATFPSCAQAQCGANEYCYDEWHGPGICVARYALGASCLNVDIDVNSCADGSYCNTGIAFGDAAEGVCDVQATTTCTPTATRFGCTGGNVCSSSGVCAAPVPKGGGCGQDWDCAVNLACVGGSCAPREVLGQSCTQYGAQCGFGTMCAYGALEAGTCRTGADCAGELCCADDAGVGSCFPSGSVSSCATVPGTCQPQ